MRLISNTCCFQWRNNKCEHFLLFFSLPLIPHSTGNPSVITSSKQLFFTHGEIIPGDDREQYILMSGNPEPTLQNVQWFLNGTIPLSTMSQFTVLDYALSLPPVIGYEHSGNYTIVVTTSAGSVRDSFVITVGGKWLGMYFLSPCNHVKEQICCNDMEWYICIASAFELVTMFTCQEYPSGVACFVEWLISHPKGSDVSIYALTKKWKPLWAEITAYIRVKNNWGKHERAPHLSNGVPRNLFIYLSMIYHMSFCKCPHAFIGQRQFC